jgi:hypothetical protein
MPHHCRQLPPAIRPVWLGERATIEVRGMQKNPRAKRLRTLDQAVGESGQGSRDKVAQRRSDEMSRIRLGAQPKSRNSDLPRIQKPALTRCEFAGEHQKRPPRRMALFIWFAYRPEEKPMARGRESEPKKRSRKQKQRFVLLLTRERIDLNDGYTVQVGIPDSQLG